MVALFFSRCFSQQSSFATRAPFRWRCSSGGWKSVCSFSEWSASRRLAASLSAARVRVIAFSMLRHIFERVEQVVARVSTSFAWVAYEFACRNRFRALPPSVGRRFDRALGSRHSRAKCIAKGTPKRSR